MIYQQSDPLMEGTTFFVVNIQPEAQSIFRYGNQSDAMSAYHSTLASNYAAGLASFSVSVLDHNGTMISHEFYNSEETE